VLNLPAPPQPVAAVPPVPATIMLVEDDVATERTISRALETSGYRVVVAGTGAEARALLQEVHPDLIILDLMLPDTDGLVLTTSFRALTDAAILICSARHQQVDRVLGLKLGAADFVAKPFDLDELEARIEAILRRVARSREASSSTDELIVGDLLIAPHRATVRIGDRPLHLTPTEYRLLVALASHPETLLTREALGQIVWGYQDLGSGHLIDVHIGRLRVKLKGASPDGPTIVTVRGRGYRLLPHRPEGRDSNGEAA
jgi:two-component system, OmpR family, alkaline phosphatase synthesis response regulator PhoP